MNVIQYRFNRLAILLDICIYRYNRDENFIDYNTNYNETPLKSVEALRLSLIDKARGQSVPVIWNFK